MRKRSDTFYTVVRLFLNCFAKVEILALKRDLHTMAGRRNGSNFFTKNCRVKFMQLNVCFPFEAHIQCSVSFEAGQDLFGQQNK